MQHVLTISERHYEEIRVGFKLALYRADAEHVESGDMLRLNEHDELTGIYTGRWILVRATHLEYLNHIDRSGCIMGKQIVSIKRHSDGVDEAYVMTVEGTYVTTSTDAVKSEVTAA